MNVLSLFDGISCGQIALERAGIKVNNYFASEIDKYAIQVTQKNYPSTVQLGDVTKVFAKDLPKIDLLTGGFCCQSFSFAGKQLNFNDPRGKLFFECVRILQEIKEYNPNIKFLFENVKMKKEYSDIISEYLGVDFIQINSSLVSAQNRVRNYWTNINGVTDPNDKGVVIKDILESKKGEHFIVSEQGKCFKKGGEKSYCLLARDYKGFGNQGMSGVIGMATDIKGYDILKRIYRVEGKAPTLTAVCGGNQEKKVAISQFEYRKLTPLEYERLQNVPDNYSNCVSNTQRYKQLGNGWTVDVIAHIFSSLKGEEIFNNFSNENV